MSKFGLNLKFKDIKILKHSLEKRIAADQEDYKLLKVLSPKAITIDGEKFIKEHEEHIKCLENLTKEMKRVGYRHGKNIFGSKYHD